jgi:hypothetical protein
MRWQLFDIEPLIQKRHNLAERDRQNFQIVE